MDSKTIQIKKADLGHIKAATAERYGDRVSIETAKKGLNRSTKLGQIELIEILISVVATVSLEEVISYIKYKVSKKNDKDDSKEDGDQNDQPPRKD